MTIHKLLKLLRASWSGTVPVDDVSRFDLIEEWLSQPLPADYKFFLMWSNGGETLPPLSHYRFYPLGELLELKESGLPPAVFEFATNDADGLAFDLSVNRDTAKYPIVRYPLGDTERVDMEPVANDFAEFIIQRVLVTTDKGHGGRSSRARAVRG